MEKKDSPDIKQSKLIYEKMGNVVKTLSENPIGKNGVNNHQKYKYRSIDDLYNSFSTIFANENIFVLSEVIETKSEDKALANKVEHNFTVRIKYSFVCSLDGSQVTTEVYGHGVDYSDKAPAKAFTMAFKIALSQTFLTPFENTDPDSETIEKQLTGIDAIKDVKGLNEFYNTNKNDLDIKDKQSLKTKASKLNCVFDTQSKLFVTKAMHENQLNVG